MALAVPADLAGQRIAGIEPARMSEVMPEAERFGEPTADPAVVPAYALAADGSEALIGYVFLTSDHPPEQIGYSGPIEALVGMRLDGTLSGVRVIRYVESYRQQMGDFLRRAGFQQQFAGKYVGDPFRVWGDVDGMSRVTISVRALSRGIRDSSRRVLATHVGLADEPDAGADGAEVVGRTWFELNQMGVLERLELEDPGEGSAAISIAFLDSDPTGEYFLGRRLYERATRTMRMRDDTKYLLLYAVEGPRLRLFVPEGWSIEQDGDTTEIDPGDIVSLALQPDEGIVATEASMVGVMMIERELDLRRPFRLIYDLGSRLGVHDIEYAVPASGLPTSAVPVIAADRPETLAPDRTEDPDSPIPSADAAGDSVGRGSRPAGPSDSTAAVAAAEAPARATPAGLSVPESTSAADAPDWDSLGEGATAGAVTAPAVTARAATAATPEAPLPELATPEEEPGPASAPVPDVLQTLDFTVTVEETLLQSTLADTSWWRVARMLFVLALALWAFFAKTSATRWLSVGATLLILGFADGSFLSVSHITSGIWTGVDIFLMDLPLLLITIFTVVTTLVWGRVFCGFLCPFGALQDVIERVVPRRFQRALPRQIHVRALYIKYGILALIILPALAGSHTSLYQYFEPFGTVFFLSPSLFFWSIAVLFLLASAVVPRFYCRYACPLGAALAIGSLVSLKRIERVEQCNHCKVCEQACPTGAIHGPHIDFKECVRCNECEVLLRRKAGVCRHDMEDVRSRLIQLRVGGATGMADRV